jgi:hypothetical protein
MDRSEFHCPARMAARAQKEQKVQAVLKALAELMLPTTCSIAGMAVETAAEEAPAAKAILAMTVKTEAAAELFFYKEQPRKTTKASFHIRLLRALAAGKVKEATVATVATVDPEAMARVIVGAVIPVSKEKGDQAESPVGTATPEPLQANGT